MPSPAIGTRTPEPPEHEQEFRERVFGQLALVLGLGSLPALISLVVPEVPLILSGSSLAVSGVFAGVIAGVQLKDRRERFENADQ